MAEAKHDMREVTQSLSYDLDQLRANVRPLRAQVEDLVLALRSELLAQGITAPVLMAALDLGYVGEGAILTVPFPIEIEDAAVCAADPLPLDRQALREAVTAFYAAYALQHGAALPDQQVQVVRLRIRAEIEEE